MRPIIGRTKYPLDVIELEPHEEIGFDGFVVQGFPVKHRVEAFGYAFIEDDRPGRFDAETATKLGVTPGPDFGRLQRGETVDGVTPEQVMGAGRLGRRIVYSGDTMPCQTTEVYANGADVLIHEATFCEDEQARARETGHSTANRPPSSRSTRTSSCSRSRTCPRATSRARSATRPAPPSRTRSSRVTSTASRSRSRSVASRTSSRPSWSSPHRRPRARPRPGRRGSSRRLEPARQAGEGRRGRWCALRHRRDRPVGTRRARRRVIEGGLSWAGLGFMAGPRLHIGYFATLQRAYEHGDLSVVYRSPAARARC